MSSVKLLSLRISNNILFFDDAFRVAEIELLKIQYLLITPVKPRGKRFIILEHSFSSQYIFAQQLYSQLVLRSVFFNHYKQWCPILSVLIHNDLNLFRMSHQTLFSTVYSNLGTSKYRSSDMSIACALYLLVSDECHTRYHLCYLSCQYLLFLLFNFNF